MAGFTIRGGDQTVQPFTAGAAVAVGDMVKLSSGKVVPVTSDATGIVGAVASVPDGTIADGTTGIEVHTSPDAIYAVTDASARTTGTALDYDTVTTGAQTVTTATNKDLIVAAASTATEETLVRVNRAKHFTVDLT